MAILIQGTSGQSMEVESNTQAQRVVSYGIDDGANGTFSLATTTGTMNAGLGASSEIFQFRWVHASVLALINRVRISVGNTATSFTAGVCLFDLCIARSWTIAGTGGTTATLTGNNNKRRTSMATSVMPTGGGEIRYPNAGTALTAGTKTFDSQSAYAVGGSVTATAGTALVPAGTVLIDARGGQSCPIVLANQEGFSIRATVPATGTWAAHIDVEWIETASYALGA